MTQIGRNDPCPCDSGKKYKKCCLVKDQKIADPKRFGYEEQLNAIVDNPMPPYTPDKDTMDTYQKAVNELKEYLASNEVTKNDVFHLFENFHTLACNAEQFDDFFMLADQVKNQYPDIYKKEGRWIAKSAIDIKFREEEYAEAQKWFLEYARLCDADLDFFYPELERMIQYCFLDTALKGIETIWPDVQKDTDFFFSVKEELRLKYFDLLCCREYLKSNGAITKDELQNKMDEFKLKGADEEDDFRILEKLCAQTTIGTEHIETDFSIFYDDRELLEETSIKVMDAFLWYLFNNKSIQPELGLYYWLHIIDYDYNRTNELLGIEQENLTHSFLPEKKTINKHIMIECMGMYRLHLEPLKAFAFLQAILLWIEFLSEHDLTDGSPLPLLKDITDIFVTLYNLTTIERASRDVKRKGKEILATLQKTIQKCQLPPAYACGLL